MSTTEERLDALEGSVHEILSILRAGAPQAPERTIWEDLSEKVYARYVEFAIEGGHVPSDPTNTLTTLFARIAATVTPEVVKDWLRAEKTKAYLVSQVGV